MFGFMYVKKLDNNKKHGTNIQDHKAVKCFIPALHLTDHVSLAASLLNTFHANDVIEEAVCFEKDAVPIMSLKQSLIQVF
jgi:hypothetical protein